MIYSTKENKFINIYPETQLDGIIININEIAKNWALNCYKSNYLLLPGIT